MKTNQAIYPQCPDCKADTGIFNWGNICCRERHYRNTLEVSPQHAGVLLKEIRIKHGATEADQLMAIQPSARTAQSAAKAEPKQTARQAASSF